MVHLQYASHYIELPCHWNLGAATMPLLRLAVAAIAVFVSVCASAFSTSTTLISRGGGRAPGAPDKIDRPQGGDDSDDDKPWEARPSEPSEARLIVLQITDVYTLENFASFKTLLADTRAKAKGATVICALTGDFLSPYLLSSVDRGAGMMRALSNIPMDYLTWGNHEADIDHRTVCKHVQQFSGVGKWINSNMLDHAAMQYQHEYDVVEIAASDESHTRRVGLCAVLSDDPALYSQFKEPGAFGGATVTDPWEALAKYKKILEDEQNCDFVLPLEHLYVPDDHKTCSLLDFPVVLSGHDHQYVTAPFVSFSLSLLHSPQCFLNIRNSRVDEVVDGTRLIKPGMNGVYATVLEISWKDASTSKPEIKARFVKCDRWEPDPTMQEMNERAYDVLAPMRNTELARVPPIFEPLSSSGSREQVCTMGKFICSLLKSSMNVSRRQRKLEVDAVLIMGGNLRGNADYPHGSFFSLEGLEAEVKADEVIAVVPMPGWLLAEGIQVTHAGDPIPGWMQYDEGIQEDYGQHPPVVTHVAREPIDMDRIYRVATKISDLANGQCPAWTEYFAKHPEALPPKGAYVNVHAELMGYFARNLWRKLWDAVSLEIASECNIADNCNAAERLAVLDVTGDGVVTVDEIHIALRDRLGYSVDDREKSLAEFVHSFADTTGNGQVTKQDLEVFCEEMEDLYKRDSWRLAYATPSDPKARKESATPVVK